MSSATRTVNRTYAERVAAEAHLVYELRKAPAALDAAAGVSGRRSASTVPSAPAPTAAVAEGSAGLEGYIARADALVRGNGEIEPGAEAVAVALLCSIVAARRAEPTLTLTPLR